MCCFFNNFEKLYRSRSFNGYDRLNPDTFDYRYRIAGTNKIQQNTLVLYALKSFYHSEICRFDKITDAFTGCKCRRISNNRFLLPILELIHLFFCSRFVQTIGPFILGIKTQCNESRRMNYSQWNPLSRRMGRINACLSRWPYSSRPSAHWIYRWTRVQNSQIRNVDEPKLFPEFSIFLRCMSTPKTVLTRSFSKPIQLQPSPPPK